MEPGATYVVLASYLPLSRISSTVKFFRAVSALRKQLAQAEGLVGYTLRAKPLARHYWTLSVWKSDDDLQAFVRTPPHSEVMRELRPLLDATKFAQWQIAFVDGQPGWNEALWRIASLP
jgi:heme-degrading monooxygenase HmoA